MDVNDFFMSGGGKSFKFTNHGDTAKGQIVSAETLQQTDFKTREPKFWKDGSPMLHVRIVLATDQRDPDKADDDGHRAIYAKGAMQYAIRDAIIAAGCKTLEVGGTLAVKYTGDGVAEGNLNAPKLFSAQYKAPVASVSVEDLI